MDIEIKTTKKKLSKQLISQMPSATVEVFKNGTVLGYMLNVHKIASKIMLIEHEGEYFISPMNWETFDTKHDAITRRHPKGGSVRKTFQTDEACINWWEAYSSALAKATDHIYI